MSTLYLGTNYLPKNEVLFNTEKTTTIHYFKVESGFSIMLESRLRVATTKVRGAFLEDPDLQYKQHYVLRHYECSIRQGEHLSYGWGWCAKDAYADAFSAMRKGKWTQK